MHAGAVGVEDAADFDWDSVDAEGVEEERFGATLEQGIQKFGVMVDQCSKQGAKVLAGSDVFALYDTYGFPMDLTRLMAAEKGLTIDEKEFGRLMEEQKTRGREARRADEAGLTPGGWIEIAPCAGTTFVGYEQDRAAVNVCRYKAVENGEGGTAYLLILDKTPFYAASGGQVGDIGCLRTTTGKTIIVNDTIKWNDLVVHRCHADSAVIREDFSGSLIAAIEQERRAAIRRNHSATHLLQAALRTILGSHVRQSGSRVDASGLRFDFTHFKALEKDQLDGVENLVNAWILDDVKVDTVIMDTEEAKKEGAMALFGEKYGDRVRVVIIGGVSKELCGGTHVSSTGRIGLFHIVEESSISAGVRRIEAITGMESLKFFQRTECIVQEAAALFKTGRGALLERMKATLDTVDELARNHAALSAEQTSHKTGLILESACANKGALKWHVHNAGSIDKKSFGAILNGVSDAIRQKKLDTAVIVLAGVSEGAVMLAACAGDAAVREFGIHCGEIVKAASVKVSGSGGGSAARAQAGGKDPSKLDDALAEARRIISQKTKAAR